MIGGAEAGDGDERGLTPPTKVKWVGWWETSSLCLNGPDRAESNGDEPKGLAVPLATGISIAALAVFSLDTPAGISTSDGFDPSTCLSTGTALFFLGLGGGAGAMLCLGGVAGEEGLGVEMLGLKLDTASVLFWTCWE